MNQNITNQFLIRVNLTYKNLRKVSGAHLWMVLYPISVAKEATLVSPHQESVFPSAHGRKEGKTGGETRCFVCKVSIHMCK